LATLKRDVAKDILATGTGDGRRPIYFDASRFKTYMEQLGIKYPTVR